MAKGKHPKVETQTVYERIKVIRNIYGDSQDEFAKRLGVPQSQISYLESGQREPNYEMLNKLIDMGWDVEWIIKGAVAQKDKDVNLRAINNMVEKLKPEEIRFVRKVLEMYMKHNKESGQE